MSTGYEQFFKAAKAARRDDAKSKSIRRALRMKKKTPRPPLPWTAIAGLSFFWSSPRFI